MLHTVGGLSRSIKQPHWHRQWMPRGGFLFMCRPRTDKKDPIGEETCLSNRSDKVKTAAV